MFKKIISSVLLTLAFSPLVSANQLKTCNSDVDEMMTQVHKYGSITTQQGDRFTYVSNEATSGASCMADGSYLGRYVCRIHWEMGNWGNTFHCN